MIEFSLICTIFLNVLMQNTGQIADFIDQIEKHFDQGSLHSVVISKPVEKANILSKITIKPVQIQSEIKAQATLQQGNQQVHKNLSSDELRIFLTESLGTHFLRAFVITATEQVQFMVSSRGKITVIQKKVMHDSPGITHNNEKKYLVPATAPFLHPLGITSAQGNVISEMKRKFLQINRFVEIFSSLVSSFLPDKPLQIIDMGCGKGYLTFAMFDYLRQQKFQAVQVTGVDIKSAVMAHCNTVAKQCNFDSLKFIESSIQDYPGAQPDVLVALHACDTATDDALYFGIKQKAKLIIVAPCCQKQVRRSLQRETDLTHSLYEYGLATEKFATLFTDLIRINVLKYLGYRVKMQEFIGLEHTAKNVMISAEYTGYKQAQAMTEIKSWMQIFGIGSHYLLDKLNIE